MPLFLHTADWQIGRHFAQFTSDDAAHIAEERVNVIARIAAEANGRGADAILVAGDVFDAQQVSDRWIRRLFAATAHFKGPWIVIPGNHDAALAAGVWTQAMRLGLPANFQLALTPGVISLPDLHTAVLAAPLTQRHTYTDTTAFFDQAETPAGWLRIGLAHGSVEGVLAEEIDSTNPISSERCLTAHLDYLALGDWHGTKIINERCAYSGTPEQDRFKRNDPGNCLLVQVELGQVPSIETLRVGRYRWHDVLLDIAVDSDIDLCCRVLSEFGGDDIAQVAIAGHMDLAGQARLRDAIGAAEAAMRALTCDVNDLRLLPTDEDLAALRADGYLAEVIDELRSEQEEGADPEAASQAREALTVLCTALAERQVKAGQSPSLKAAA